VPNIHTFKFTAPELYSYKACSVSNSRNTAWFVTKFVVPLMKNWQFTAWTWLKNWVNCY